MSTKRLQFFITSEEFFNSVVGTLAHLELELIGAIQGTWCRIDAEATHRPLFIAPRGTDRPSPELIRPGREGWLVVNPPMVEGRKLFLTEIAAKSDWSDPDANMTRSNPDVERLFGRVARQLRRKLQFSVMAINEVTGKSGTYKAIGYSEGARRWLDESGQWRQQGVDNVRFGLQ